MSTPMLPLQSLNHPSKRKAMLHSSSRSALKTLEYVLTGRLHFERHRLGQIVTADDGQSYTIFREIVVDPRRDQPEKSCAVFILHFRVTNLSPRLNRLLLLLPIPLYVGFPGFRSKVYTINGSFCQSIYEFDTVQDAEAYARSAALQFITRRSVPGSVSYKIIPNKG
jgi:hypothetical protein